MNIIDRTLIMLNDSNAIEILLASSKTNVEPFQNVNVILVLLCDVFLINQKKKLLTFILK